MEPYHAMLPPTSSQEAAAPETGDGESSSLEDDAELRQRLQAAMEDPYMQPEPEMTDEEASIPTDLEAAEAVLEVAADGGGGDVVPERASSARPVDVRSSSTSRRRKEDKKKEKRDKKKKKRGRSRSRGTRSARRARSTS